ncbi:MAG: DNA repair protein RecN [Gemmatimonadota bacterium]
MLKELRIRDYAVLDEIVLELNPGLTVLSGETGAGKSIIVGALSVLLGERASSQVVREPEGRAVVEGAFDVSARPRLAARLRELGLEPEDAWLLLRRELQREGRNRAWVGGSRASAGLLGELGSALVELHGQHEHQSLLRRPAQRRILDAYAGATGLAAAVVDAHREWTETRTRMESVRRRAAEVLERADYLRFKAEEIERAELREDEEDRLRSEARRLAHAEELVSLSGGLYEAVHAGEDSLVERLGRLRRPLAELTRIDPRTEELHRLWEEARVGVEELGRRLGAYGSEVEHDPDRLHAVQSRLDLLFRLKSKYGGGIEEVIAAGREARREIEGMEGSDLELRELEGASEAARRRFEKLAGELGAERRGAAARLEAEMARLLPELGMAAGRFQVELQTLETPGPSGAERVEFRVTLNAGFPPAPLRRVASGGEMSRLMLALKTALAAVDEVPCLVFDEIDAGIGGTVAHRVAERLARLAERHQVFVVTHLPQIAARADHHFSVRKGEEKGRTVASVRRLEGAERVTEMARMLGGDPESETSRRHARELLEAC